LSIYCCFSFWKSAPDILESRVAPLFCGVLKSCLRVFLFTSQSLLVSFPVMEDDFRFFFFFLYLPSLGLSELATSGSARQYPSLWWSVGLRAWTLVLFSGLKSFTPRQDGLMDPPPLVTGPRLVGGGFISFAPTAPTLCCSDDFFSSVSSCGALMGPSRRALDLEETSMPLAEEPHLFAESLCSVRASLSAATFLLFSRASYPPPFPVRPG